MNTDDKAGELPIVITPLKTILGIIQEEHRKRHLAQQDSCELEFNRAIEVGLARIKKLLDTPDIPIPYYLDEDRLMALIERYRLTGWTMYLITEDAKNRYLRFTPVMDYQCTVFRPS
jgi:hypothetical protein